MSLFGATSTSPFGATTASPFGATTASPFGAAASKPATPAFGGFGTTPATSAPATSLFGTTPAPASTTTSPFGGFGATATSTAAPATSTPAFGGFGTTPATAPATSSPFGGLGTSTATTPAFGGFGAPAAGTSLFGASTAAKPNPFGFGASTTAAPTQFGATLSHPQGFATGLNASVGSQVGTTRHQSYITSSLVPNFPVWQHIENIKNAWDPTHPNCEFKYYFYNFVHPDEAKLYTPSPNEDRYEWHQAMLASPDPSCMVPVLAVGFTDLKKRMESQDEMTLMQKEKLQEIERKMDELTKHHLIQTASRVREFKRRHIQLSQRILTLMKRVQIMKNRGVPIKEEEEQLRVRLENALEQLKNPAYFRGKITELWAQVQILKDSKRLHQASDSFSITDDTQVEVITKFLEDQQNGLQHITAVLQQDMEDIELLQRKLEEIIPAKP
ncbi:hypothetical protein BGZ73_006099 [Actinomortierella ambigua]|nr:hypothetical protein BGZ73_006099 [Actinomortierella ambigua]